MKGFAKRKDSGRLRVVVTTESRVKNREVLLPGTMQGEQAKAGRCDFIFNPNKTVEADFWIVFANARPADVVLCAPENTLFVAAEPESKKVYPLGFYRQFHRIVDTHKKSRHPRIKLHAPCLSWHVGLDHVSHEFKIGYDQLKEMQIPDNPVNAVSVVCSNADFTEGQRTRLKFLADLKKELGNDLVHFGRGFNAVNDKLDAILNYRFHLVLENSQLPHYWTEKLADAYLGWAFPLYVGSPNIEEYFPCDTYVPLSVDSPEKAANTIKKLLAKPRTDFEKSAVKRSRELILDVYNPWLAWARWAEDFHDAKAKKRHIRILSHKAFRPFPRGLIYRLRRVRCNYRYI